MIYILTNTKIILETHVRPQESNVGDSVAQGILNLKLKQQLTPQTFLEQQNYLDISAIAAYVSLNKLDQRHRYRASVNLRPLNNESFNFTEGSSSSGLGYAIALFDSWWNAVLNKSGGFKYPVFVTGEILTSGQVQPISHITDKINSACSYVRENQDRATQFYLCYPEQNDLDISPEQRKKVTKLGGILIPVSRLQSLLGELLGESYDGDPLGRWEPFKGLKSFNYEDSVRFFGRSKDVDRLYDDLKQNNGLLIVTGASGTGKSSLIKAGLIPRLEQKDEQLYWAYTTPSQINSEEGITSYIVNQLNNAWQLEKKGLNVSALILMFSNSIEDGIQHLQSFVTEQTPHCLLYFDQYEEVFSQNGKNVKGITQDLSLIDVLARQLKPLDIVLALRNEYLGRLLDNQALNSPVVSNVASQLLPEEWYAIVHEQAAFSGIGFEQDESAYSLDEIIIAEAVKIPYALPMVEFLLEQLYLKAINQDQNAKTLQIVHYEELGGLSGAIACRAAQVLKDNQANTKLVMSLFDYFVGMNGEQLPYARQVNLKELASINPVLSTLVEEFINANLIVSVANTENEPLVKLAHDSLFSQWHELKEWVESYKDYHMWRYSIDGQFIRWREIKKAQSKSKAYLLKDRILLKEAKLYQKKEMICDNNLRKYIVLSQKHKRKSIFTFLFVFVVFPALVIALYQWDQHRVKSYYYAAIGEKWSIPFGINELTSEQVRRTQNYFRLDFQGGLLIRKSHKKPEIFDFSFDGESNNRIFSEYKYTDDGRLFLVETKAQTGKIISVNRHQYTDKNKAIVAFGKKNLKLKFIDYKKIVETKKGEVETKKNSDISQHLLVYSDEGFIKKRIFQNPYGVASALKGDIYGKLYEYDSQGLVVLEYSLAKDLTVVEKDGLYSNLYEYNANGYLLKNKRVKRNGDYVYLNYKYDDYGNKVEESYHNKKGGLVLRPNGHARVVSKFDYSGDLIEYVFYNDDGNVAETKDGVSILRLKNNEIGLPTEISLFGKNHEPTLFNSFSKVVLEYDNLGNRIEESFYGVKGDPVLLKTGYSKLKTKYDDTGNKIEIIYFDTDYKPVLQTDGCAKSTFKYSELGVINEQACYGVNGELAPDYRGIARGIIKHDAQGNNIEEAFYGVDGMPILTVRGYSKSISTYDKNGYMNGISFFGLDNEPVLVDGAARIKSEYDNNGNIIEYGYYGIDGNPILVNGIANTILKYNNNKKEIVFLVRMVREL